MSGASFDPGDVRIRRAVPADAPALAPLLDDVGFPAAADVIVERLTSMSGSADRILVAERSGSVVGLATLHATPALHRPAPVGRITLLVVAADDRGRGIGRSLVEACEQETAAAGGTIVEVISNKRYADAHGFYERLGYNLSSYKFKKMLAK